MHQCVRCGILYEDGSNELLKGCSCGGKFFFYIRKEAAKETQEIISNLTTEQKQEIEHDVMNFIGDKIEEDKPVVLDLESIRILGEGKFELDIVKLFNKKMPLIYKLEEGKYIIDLASTFQRSSELSEEKE